MAHIIARKKLSELSDSFGGVKQQKIEPIACQTFSTPLTIPVHITDATKNGQPDIKNNRITTVEGKIILPYKSHANSGHLQRAIIMLRAVPKYFKRISIFEGVRFKSLNGFS